MASWVRWHRGQATFDRRTFAVFVLVTAAVPFLLGGTSYMAILTLTAIFGAVAISLDLLVGYGGLLSLGQMAPFGVAAYTAAILSTTHGWPSAASAVGGIAAAVALALATSPILRLEGFYFALATLAIALICEAVMRNWISLTGGSSGFVGIGQFQLGPLTLSSETDTYWMAWVVMVGAALVGLRVVSSRFGRALLAVHEDEQAARALGVPVGSVKVRIWLLAAGIAGGAGVAYTYYIRFLSPPQFGLGPSILLVIAIVLGGLRSIYGAVVGVAIVRLLPEVFESFAEHSVLVYGVAIVVVTVLMPGGIYGAGRDLWRRLRARRHDNGDREPIGGDAAGSLMTGSEVSA